MEMYIGVKAIKAKPMKYSEYAALTRRLIDNEKDEEGYLVEYLDSPNNNVVGYSNYISWSPKDVFERAYFNSGKLSFGLAFEAMQMGFIVSNPYLDKEAKKGLLIHSDDMIYTLGVNGIERIWTPDLYALRCKEWTIVGLANK